MLELHVPSPPDAKCNAVITYVCPVLWSIDVLEPSHEVRDSYDLLHASSDLVPIFWLCLNSTISSETVKFLVGFLPTSFTMPFWDHCSEQAGKGILLSLLGWRNKTEWAWYFYWTIVSTGSSVRYVYVSVTSPQSKCPLCTFLSQLSSHEFLVSYLSCKMGLSCLLSHTLFTS